MAVDFCERVELLVGQMPRGNVTTYGDIATLAGYAGIACTICAAGYMVDDFERFRWTLCR